MKLTDQKLFRCLRVVKSIVPFRTFGVFVVASFIALTLRLAPEADAMTRTKANNTNNLNLTTSWTGGVVPASGDIALWDSTVTTANMVSLGVDLNFGEIQITNPGGLVTINAGNTLTLSGVSGVGIDMSSASQNLTLNCAITLGAAQAWNIGSTSNSRTLTVGGNINNGGNLLTIDTPNGNQVFINGTLSGTGGLRKTGNQNLSVSASSTYSGVTTLDGGFLIGTLANVNTASSIGKGSVAGSAADLVFGNGILFGSGSTDRLFTIGDANGLSASLYSVGSPMNFTSTGAIAFGGSGSRSLTLYGATTGNTFAPILGDGAGGATSLTKSHTGTWTITGANTYSGGTQVTDGTLTVSGSGTLGASTGSLNVGSFYSGSVTILNLNVDQSVGSLTGFVSAGASATINIASGKTLTVNQSTNTTYAGVIASSGSLTKSGTGTLTLSGANSYTGATNINGGKLSLDSAGSTTPRLASTSTITVNSGGTLLLANSSGTVSIDRIGNSVPVTLSGGGTINTGGLSEGTRPTNSGSINGAAGIGALTLSSTSAGSHATIDFLTGANGSTLVFSSLVGGSGAFADIKNWTGILGTDNSATTNDRLLFATNPGLTAAQLANYMFFNDSATAIGSGATIIAYGNEFELVPVPEPATWIVAALAIGVIARNQQRRFSRAPKPG